jgi:Stage II sporulation protein E (SpoIIE)
MLPGTPGHANVNNLEEIWFWRPTTEYSAGTASILSEIEHQRAPLLPVPSRALTEIPNKHRRMMFWRRTAWFEPQRTEEGLGVRGTPLGLLPNVSYDRMIVKPDPGDLIVLYSDGVSEATNLAGKELGRDDLLTLARALNPISAKTFGVQLVEAVGEFRGGSVPEDDETIIVLQRLPDQLG